MQRLAQMAAVDLGSVDPSARARLGDLARRHAQDWLDDPATQQWAADVAAAIGQHPPPPPPPPAASVQPPPPDAGPAPSPPIAPREPGSRRGSWIVAGVIGLAALAGLASLAPDQNDNDPEPSAAAESAPDLSWTIVLRSTDQKVRLTGRLPHGVPTETWVDGQLLDQSELGDFVWDLGESPPIPLPIAHHDGMTCDELVADVSFWTRGASKDDAKLDAVFRQLAYAQHALDLASERGC
ncbi:MAG: hypothetical protein GY704_03500 [Phycisphaeraceae bacterium]|nr:hypothetical protein [Phycisphaeraceae bacterium]